MTQNQDSDLLRPYEADGIQEMDNRLPQWWVGLFVGTIVFSVFYMAYLHVMGKALIDDEYARAMAVAAERQASSGGGGSDLNAVMADPSSVKSGHEVYTANCAPCHGDAGQGTIGPNLTDKAWLHGGKPEQIFASIENGYAEKGMPGWGAILGPLKTKQVTAFVHSIKGTTPPNPKAAQGDLEE
jgi:cytochrome c oxidase cbb3-type subunit 3